MKIIEILKWLDSREFQYKFIGETETELLGFSSITNYKEGTLSWIKKAQIYNKLNRPSNITCAVVQSGIDVDFTNVIVSETSKEIFFAILRNFWGTRCEEGRIGEGTVIDQNADIDSTVSVGCNCSILGNVLIGAHTIIDNNVVIQGNIKIGSNCVIHSGTVIGTDGFGYFFKDNGTIGKVEHFGGIVIGNNVEIGANVCIDRGTIDDTFIDDNSKIDNLVHIAHNVKIGKSVCVVAGAAVCGSVVLHDGAYIAPGGIVKNQLEVGKDGFVGLGAVVTQSVGEKSVVAGIPAKLIRKIQKGDK